MPQLLGPMLPEVCRSALERFGVRSLIREKRPAEQQTRDAAGGAAVDAATPAADVGSAAMGREPLTGNRDRDEATPLQPSACLSYATVRPLPS